MHVLQHSHSLHIRKIQFKHIFDQKFLAVFFSSVPCIWHPQEHRHNMKEIDIIDLGKQDC